MSSTSVKHVDPNWNTSDAEALRTIRHEACHVATWGVMDPNDPHDPPFQECMKGFKEK
jgi:predicted SprT family Zn-dependent metalloprotease